MEREVTTQKTEQMESAMVKKFVTDLRNGTSFLQQPNKEPSYIQNYASNKPYLGINMLIVNQGMKDAGKKCNLAMSAQQGETMDLWPAYGTKSIGNALYDNSKAYYQKNDAEVISGQHTSGEHKKDADGKLVKDTNYSHVFAAEDFVKKEFKVERNAEGQAVRYEKDEYAVDKDGKIMTYQKDGEYKNYKNQIVEYKKGDKVIAHSAGSVKGKYIATDNHVVKAEANHLSSFVEDKDLAALYKRKDNSGKEILVEKLSEAFRGKLQGNYEGMKIQKSEIDAIEKEFLNHPRAFRGVVKSAETRAEGNKEAITRMDAAILAKISANNNTQKVELENTTKNKKSIKR